MCLPAAAAAGAAAAAPAAMSFSTALQIGGTALSFAQQSRQASQTNRYLTNEYNQNVAHREEVRTHQIEQYTENADRVDQNVKTNYKELMEMIRQHGITHALNVKQISNNARRMQSGTTAELAERGITGLTADTLYEEIERNQLNAISNAEQQQEWVLDSLIKTGSEIEARGQAQIDQMIPAPLARVPLPQLVSGPNPLESMLNLGANVLETARLYNYDPFRTLQNTTTATANTSAYFNTGNPAANTSNRLSFN